MILASSPCRNQGLARIVGANRQEGMILMKDKKPRDEETLNEPVLDGATETFEGDEDPRKGEKDPALIRHPEEGQADRNVNPYG